MHNKTIISFGFRMTARIIKDSIGLCYPPQPLASGRFYLTREIGSRILRAIMH